MMRKKIGSMAKVTFKPGNMLYPLPAVMVSCQRPGEKANIITIAWAATVCTNPPMLTVSIRPERYSYETACLHDRRRDKRRLNADEKQSKNQHCQYNPLYSSDLQIRAVCDASDQLYPFQTVQRSSFYRQC